jgi:peroxiredoxin
MKNIILLVFLGFNSMLFAQDYPFLSSSSKKVSGNEYIDYLNENPAKADSIHKTTRYIFEEDGSVYNKTFFDSIFKSKDGYLYNTKIFKDTISNTFSIVLYKRTKAELKEDNKNFNNYIKSDEKNRKKLKKSTLDDLILVDMKGEEHTMETLEGKIVVIDFWYINCASCVKEMPELNKLKAEFQGEDVEFFGVTYDPKDKVERFLERFTFDYIIISDSKHLTTRFDIRFYPTTLIIDENKRIVYTGKFGFMNGRVDEIREEIKKLLKSKKYTVKAGPILRMED